MKKARNWKEIKIEDGSLVMVDIKSETVAVIPEEELNRDELENLNVKLIETQTKDYWVSFVEDLTPQVYVRPFAEVRGKWMSIAGTGGKIKMEMRVKDFDVYEKKLGNMTVKVYIMGYEPVLEKTYKPVKAEMVDPQIIERDNDYIRGLYYSGYRVEYQMKYTYENGATATVSLWGDSKYKTFFEETPRLWIYKDDKGKMVTEASEKDIAGAEYYLTETGAYRKPIKTYIEKERLLREVEYNYYSVSNRTVDKIPVLGEKEPCRYDEVPEECDYDYKGDCPNEKFAMVRQMYLRYGSVEGALKAIESFEDDKKKFYAEKMPELKAKAEAWVKENF